MTTDHEADFARDGVVVMRGLLDDGWVARLATAVDRVRIEQPNYASLKLVG